MRGIEARARSPHAADIDRHHAPAGDGELHFAQRQGDGVAHARGGGFIVRQKHQPRGVQRAQRDARLARQRAQPGVGSADQHAAAVATQAVGGDAAAVGHAHQRVDRALHQRARRHVVELGDQAKATAVPLVAGVVQTGLRARVGALVHGVPRRMAADNTKRAAM